MHSRLSPSSAAQWIFCPGSIRMQEGTKVEKSPEAMDGETAHDLGALALKYGFRPDQIDSDLPKQINGMWHPEPAVEPTVVTDEIIDAVRVYVAAVQATTGLSINEAVLIEEKINIPLVHEFCFGTSDVVDTDSELSIWDLKFGWGIVEAYMNWQLIVYALGFIDRGGWEKINLTIVQPRAPHRDGPVRTWSISREKLLSFVPQIKAAASEALSDDPRIVTGSHCKNCKAMYSCLANQQAGLGAMEISHRVSSPQVSGDQLGYELAVLRRANDLVTQRLKATEALVMAKCKNGDGVPGWTIENNMGALSWNPKQQGEIQSVADMYGVAINKPKSLITPTQAIKAGIPRDIVTMYSTKKSGLAKLVSMDKLTIAFGGK